MLGENSVNTAMQLITSCVVTILLLLLTFTLHTQYILATVTVLKDNTYHCLLQVVISHHDKICKNPTMLVAQTVAMKHYKTENLSCLVSFDNSYNIQKLGTTMIFMT